MPDSILFDKEKNKMKNDILIAYYSWHGNTEKVAGLLHNKLGGELFEIQPEQAYTSVYGDVVKQAKQEIYSGFRPRLKSLPDMSSYSTVFIGTPIWWYTMAPPVASFLEGLNLAGKQVIPFSTHGGGGSGTFEKDVAAMCPDSKIIKGHTLYQDGGGSASGELAAWLKSVGVTR